MQYNTPILQLHKSLVVSYFLPVNLVGGNHPGACSETPTCTTIATQESTYTKVKSAEVSSYQP